MGQTRDVATQIRGAGGRVTRSRRVLWDALNTAGRHLTADQLHATARASLPTIALSTVYRTLVMLEDQGLAHHVTVGGEARYGPVNHPHHHAVCERCGTVTELDQALLTVLVDDLDAASALLPDPSTGLTIHGMCPNRHSQPDSIPPPGHAPE
jgi:Fe2+ or Zn2+ uptake regulation protein